MGIYASSKCSKISIHAPLTGSDPAPHVQTAANTSISIHAPLAGSDRLCEYRQANQSISIHAPLAGSDCRIVIKIQIRENFNPRSPRGERRYDAYALFVELLISIHAPLAGSDRLLLGI